MLEREGPEALAFLEAGSEEPPWALWEASFRTGEEAASFLFARVSFCFSDIWRMSEATQDFEKQRNLPGIPAAAGPPEGIAIGGGMTPEGGGGGIFPVPMYKNSVSDRLSVA